ncbi:MAG TPA: transcriptional regulator [Fibrobacteres bacterium]|jgi:ArsR family transcriptional regulator, lead/cadmium/zinc/bismuth-responsive transcriptional repressor|nr:transcriptional regulator [Fibrobacterota bacterium]
MTGKSKKADNVCSVKTIHGNIVKKAKKGMPSAEALYEASDFFRILGDSNRFSILWALSREEMCGCDIGALLNMTQSAVSHQMRVLRQARLVRHRRDGKMVYFSLDDDHIKKVLETGMEHTLEKISP